ncbi:TrmH family RNA methyltransferase [bacterium]|nr:TrmH family RNA methyltransferase [bacterium]
MSRQSPRPVARNADRRYHRAMDILPHLDRLTPEQRAELSAELSALVQPRRLARIDAVLAHRTRRITMLFVDTHHPHNASAAIRTCECFGIQDVHVVEETTTFRPSRDVVRGAGRWVSLHRHATCDEAITDLREAGYRVVAASVSPDSHPLETLDVTMPLAIALGSEERGFTSDELARVDGEVHVPMVGFTESLNVSVTAALLLHELTSRLRARDGWRLGADERDELRLRWLTQEGNKGRAVTARKLREWGYLRSA